MPLYSIDGPDGKTYEIEGPDGASREQIIAAIQARQQEQGAQEEDPSKQGLAAAATASIAQHQAGLARYFGHGEKGAELEKFAKDNYQPTQQSWTEAPWLKLREAAGSALPGLVAGGVGMIGGMPGLLAAALPGAVSGNVERQVAPTEEGGAGRSQDQINRLAATGMAIPEAALNAVGVRMLPGVKSILGDAFGHQISDAAAKAVAKQGLKATALDLAKSGAVGAVDMGVMGVANTFMERLQAGLDTTDPQARDEYLQSLIGGAAFGAVIGPGGRMLERGGMKRQAAAADRRDEAVLTTQREAAAQQEKDIEAQRQQTPEFALDAQQRYDALQKRWAEMLEATKVKPEKDDFAGQQARQEARAALKEFRESDEFKETVDDYLKVKPQLERMKRGQEGTMLDAAPIEGQGMQPANGRWRTEAPEEQQADTSPVQQYVQSQMAAAAGPTGLPPSTPRVISHLMQDPQMAQQIVQGNMPLPGVPKGQKATILSALKLQLDARNKQERGATKQELEQRSQDFSDQTQRVEEKNPLADYDESRQQLENDPNAVPGEYLGAAPMDDMWTKALGGERPPTMAGVPEGFMPPARADQTRQRIDDLYRQLNQAQRDHEFALKNGDREGAVAAQARREEARVQIEHFRGQRPFPDQFAGTTGHLKAGPPQDATKPAYGREVVKLRDEQHEALNDFLNTTNDLREGIYLGGAQKELGGSTRELLERKADDARARYIDAAQKEAALHYAAKGKTLTTDEALKHALSVRDMFDRYKARQLAKLDEPKLLFERGEEEHSTSPLADVLGLPEENPKSKLLPEEAVVLQHELANLRETRAGIIEPQLKAAPPEARPHIQAMADGVDKRISEITDKLMAHIQGNAESAPPRSNRPPRKPSKSFAEHLEAVHSRLITPPNKAVRIDNGVIKPQFPRAEEARIARERGEGSPTLTGELRRRAEYVTNEIDHALARKDIPQQVRSTLEKAKEAITSGQVSRDLLDALENLSERARHGSAQMADVREVHLATQAIKQAHPDHETVLQRSPRNFPIKDKGGVYKTDTVPTRPDIAQKELPGVEPKATVRATPEEFANHPALKQARKAIDDAKAAAAEAAETAEKMRTWLDEKQQAQEASTEIARHRFLTARAAVANAFKKAASNFHFGDQLAAVSKRLADAKEALRRAEQRQNLMKDHPVEEGSTQKLDGGNDEATNRRINDRVHALRKEIESDQRHLENLHKQVLDMLAQHDLHAKALMDENVQRAKTRLDKAEQQLAEVRQHADAGGVPAAQREVGQSRAALDQARNESDKLAREAYARKNEWTAKMQRGLDLSGRRHMEGRAPEDILTPEQTAAKSERERREAQERADAEREGRELDQPVRRAAGPVSRDKHGGGKRLDEARAWEHPFKSRASDNEVADKLKGEQGTALRSDETKAKQAQRDTLLAQFKQTKEPAQRAELATKIRALDKELKEADAISERERLSTDKDARRARREANKQRKTLKAQERTAGRHEEKTRAQKAVDDAYFGEERDEAGPFSFKPGDEEPGEDGPVFRTGSGGAGMRTGEVQRIAEAGKKQYPGGPEIVVVKSQSDLPFAVPEGKTVPGAFHEGKVYLVADNLHSPDDVHLTMAHEIAGHYGLRAMLGDAYERTMRRIYEGNDKVRAAADAKMKGEGLPRDIAVEEVLAEMAETNPKDSALKRAFYAVKQWLATKLGLKNVSDGEVAQIVANARRHVEEGGPGPGGGKSMTGPVFRTANKEYDVLVARDKTGGEKWREAKDVGLLNVADLWRLKKRVDFVDQHAAYEKAAALAEKAGKLPHDVAINAMHALRFGANINQAVGQAVGTGPVYVKSEKLPSGVISKTFATKRGGPTLKKVFEHVGDGARALGVHADEGAQIATTLAIGQRAEATPEGWHRLQTDIDNVDKVKALYERVKGRLAENPQAKAHFDTAMKHYKDYNDGLIDLLSQTGAISKALGERLKAVPYAPWYRVDKDEIKLVSDKEKPIVIGNLKDSPELQQMLGGSNKVMPLLESSVKNTYLITRMAMRNHQQTSMANTLWQIGAVSKMGKGTGLADKSVLHYKVDGEDHFAMVDQDVYGIPAELIAKGMEGIKTTIPAFVKMMAVPAHWVRSMVTRSPTYAVRQMVRDPVNVVFIDGMSPAGVADAFKHVGKAAFGVHDPVADKLMDSLAITSNIYANDAGDIQKFLQQAASGNANAVNKVMRRLDEFAQEADAATRQALYTDGIKTGLSDAEAQLRTLESMNFNRKGLSPSMQMLSTMIPFFNAQVQGLDVLWRSLRGQMPLNDKLDLQKKLYLRGAMLVGASMAYSAAMQDDPDYRKVKPQDRYQNFLVKTPFTKDYVKLPIPYEVGVIFKALPEAIWNAAFSDTKARDAAFGLAHVAANSLPNFEPSAVAPLVMASLNYSGFGPIESQREQQMEPEMRYHENTPETLKALGTGGSRLAEKMGLPFGVSPLMLEYFVRSYTGTMGLGIMRVLGDPAALSVEGKKAVPHASSTEADTPFTGSLFTRTEGRFLMDRAYERMTEITKAKKTFDELVAQGQMSEAKRYAQDKSNEIAMASIAGNFRQELGKLASQERMVRARPDLSTAQKDRIIQSIKQAENTRSEAFYKAAESTKALSSR